MNEYEGRQEKDRLRDSLQVILPCRVDALFISRGKSWSHMGPSFQLLLVILFFQNIHYHPLFLNQIYMINLCMNFSHSHISVFLLAASVSLLTLIFMVTFKKRSV
jgi:hypothetical protein